ncbi:MAG: lysophospholipase [Spirulinaceae cyanobacterium SM2_1_0]|nr:lysophospholipase [Spirulinaceae cyanobacterium SM2_1_0]
MTHPSLFAVGLLATGPLSAPPPPPLTPPVWWQRAIAALQTATERSLSQSATPTGMIVREPSVEFARAEPIAPGASRTVAPLTLPVATRRPATAPAPSSGAQLYQQRRAALAAGRLYTHLPTDSFASTWQTAAAQPTHQQWQQLLHAEARAITRGQGRNRLSVLLGDSLSQWFPVPLLPGGAFWLNQGISGENSQQIRQRLASLRETQPSTFYVMAGINDLRQGASDTVILANLRAIARELRQQHPDAQIVLQSLLPTRRPDLDNARIQRLNQALRQIAREERVSYLHLQPLFADADGQLRAELTTDGLHLNRQGYEVWQTALQAAEQQLRQRQALIAQR